MPLQVGPRLTAFLAEKHPTILGTTRSDGTVQMHPLWFEYRDGQIWLNGGPTRDWVAHMRRDPRVTLLVVDPKDMFRWAQIQGRVAEMTVEGAGEHIEHLSQRYFGGSYPGPTTDRLVVRIDIQRVTGSEGRQPWDVQSS
jgi:PPOX class probable F420-dependent enzyme